MTPNPYVSEVTIRLGDKDYTLQYTWRGQAQLNELVKRGDDVLVEIFSGSDPEKLAAIVAIGLEKHHPDITADFIMDQSPPLQPTIDSVLKALNLARYGTTGGLATDPLEQTPPQAKAKVRKTR